MAQAGDQHREQRAGGGLDGPAGRAARELRRERQQREGGEGPEQRPGEQRERCRAGRSSVSAIQAAPSTAKTSASPSEMFQSGKKVTAKATASAARGQASPIAAVAIVSPSGQPAG